MFLNQARDVAYRNDTFTWQNKLKTIYTGCLYMKIRNQEINASYQPRSE